MADGNFATLVSKDTSLNSATNPIFNQLTNGTTAVEVGGGVEASALRVTIANDSTGVVSIDDNGGSITVDGSVTVSATDLDIRDLSETTDHVLVFANTAKDGTGTDYVPLVDADGHLQVDILSGGGSNASIKVDDTAFTVATDSITAIGAMADETTPDSVDEGDIGILRMTLDRKLLTRVDNAAGASAVNIQDGGNTISVDDDGGSLTIDNTTLAVVGGGTEATALRVTIANDSTGVLSIDDNAGSLTIDQATHDNLNANANIQVADTDVSTTNPVPVTIVDAGTSSTEIHDYDTATVAGSSTSNHDYTVANTTFLLRRVEFAASGAMKVEIQTGPVASLATVAVGFIPKAGGKDHIEFTPVREVPVTSTGTVRIIRTNREGSSQDVYTTIMGNDIS